MRKAMSGLMAIVCLSGAAASASAAQYVYPAQGQSQSKQAKDEHACSKWATGQSGFDPAHPPLVAQNAPAPVTGSGARLRGAGAGAAVGAISGGNAGTGALAGAAVGGVGRRVRNARSATAQNQANAQQVADRQAAYDRARGACLSGRGYSVK
jgi:hypothetical protein